MLCCRNARVFPRVLNMISRYRNTQPLYDKNMIRFLLNYNLIVYGYKAQKYQLFVTYYVRQSYLRKSSHEILLHTYMSRYR